MLKKGALLFLAFFLVLGTIGIKVQAQESSVSMYRLYNPNSGEHFYTASVGEKNNLVRVGWRYEGIGWIAPSTSSHPVYRLYNPNAGDHHYTLDKSERDMLVKKGWRYEGIGWYSDDQQRVPLYRQYNPNAKAGAHNFTTSVTERNHLISVGWRDEKIGWYGIGEGKSEPVQNTQGLSPLHVQNNRIVDANNKPFVLKGISTHGLAWFPEIINQKSFSNFKYDMGLNTVRLAMYTAEYGGYCTGGNQAQLEALIQQGVNLCSQLGMYCIIDWHILSDGNPLQYKEQAKAFFAKMARQYGSMPNVIFEICNEPNNGTSWAQIKQYANEVIPVIRQYSSNLILVGTPTWSQEIDKAAQSPLNYSNVAYTLHFYAATHKDDLRNRYLQYVNQIPIVVSEFGLCDASGSGGNDLQSANQWITLLNNNQTGRIMWNASNKNETSSILQPGTNMANWSVSNLTQSGQWLKNQSSGTSTAAPVTPAPTQPVQQPASLTCTLTKSNEWVSGSSYFIQLNGVIKNTGGSSASSWKLRVTAPITIKVSQNWNCQIKQISDKTIEITPESYNGTIAAGSSANDIGIILESSAKINASSLALTVE